MQNHLFTYGSLMCCDIFERVAACSPYSTDAFLKDYQRKSIQDASFPGITFQTGSAVKGVLYFSLDNESIARLDLFEGDLYVRETVQVKTVDGQPFQAQTYVIRPEYTNRLSEKLWNFSEFLQNRHSFIRACFKESEGQNSPEP